MGGVADGLRLAAYPHLAGVGGHETQHDFHERRLARPVLAEQADYLPRRNGEVDPVTGRDRAEPFTDGLEFEDRTAGHVPSEPVWRDPGSVP